MLRLPSLCLGFVRASLLLLAVAASAAAAELPASAEGARSATADELRMLHDVLHRTAEQYRRWAFTEHRVIRDSKGRVKSETLLRHDPSKPYPEQWEPLKIDGREPTDRERARYRRRGEKSAESTSPFGGVGHPDARDRRSLGELIELGRSSIASETATHVVFEVPLIKQGNERFPPEKFQVLTRIRKQDAVLENISVRLRESFRSRLVVKVKSGEGSLDFTLVDPKRPPALVSIEGDAVASVFFVNIGGSMELKRTDLKHVKLFDERFDVQIGTLKAIDF
ncbi:MAG: hypothetical protein JNL92_15945 [Opitutaceae bacterium]|nr:hypothetical protein [Opitutaceae bacterium]